jgi:hypothetical protein
VKADAAQVRALLAAKKGFLALWKHADPEIPILNKPLRSMQSCGHDPLSRFCNCAPRELTMI